MGDTKIEWTNKTWNPVRGCSRVSPGCVNCYAERQAARFASVGRCANDSEGYHSIPAGPFHGFVTKVNGHPAWTGKVELVEKHLADPLHWRAPQKVFVNSMSDLFHESLPDEAIDRIFAVMALAPQHTFQILTKRAERMRLWASGAGNRWGNRSTPIMKAMNSLGQKSERIEVIFWPLPNVWLGVSVENQQYADERIPLLLQTPAAVRFVSYEPALGPVDFMCIDFGGRSYFDSLSGAPYVGAEAHEGKKLDWVIVGGESGPGARPFDIEWARQTVAQCKEAGVACFVKQLGAVPMDALSNDDGWIKEAVLRWPINTRFSRSLPGEQLHRIHLNDKKGGDWSEWPADLRVREFPALRALEATR